MDSLAFIYPAFGEKLSEKDLVFYINNQNAVEKYFRNVNIPNSYSKDDFSETYESILKDELESQKAAYAFSCATYDLLKERSIVPKCLAGYSLGLYAALYSAGSITFNEGSLLIGKIYDLILEEITGTDFSIAVIIGLKKKDLDEIIVANSKSVEIINENNKYSFVIAGLSREIELVLTLSIAEGGMNSKMLPIKAPYHSKFVIKAADKFLRFIQTDINVKPAQIPVISSINQCLISTNKDIENEISNNIKMNINWNKTFQKLVSMNYKRFVECGIGKSLTKIGKFIEGEYKIVGFDKVT